MVNKLLKLIQPVTHFVCASYPYPGLEEEENLCQAIEDWVEFHDMPYWQRFGAKVAATYQWATYKLRRPRRYDGYDPFAEIS